MTEGTYVILSQSNSNPDYITYVSNTDPICWSRDIKFAKKYPSFDDALNDILLEYQVYYNIITHTDVSSIGILCNMDNSYIKIIDNHGMVI